MPTKRKTVKLAEIKRATYNPRIELRPGDPDYESLKAAIATYGLVQPLVWNSRTGNLVGGHQRLSVLERDFKKKTFAVGPEIVVVDLDDRAEKELNLALNNVGGDWDEEKLAVVLAELYSEDVEGFENSGFTEKEIAAAIKIVNEEGSTPPNEFSKQNPSTVLPATTCPKCGHKWQATVPRPANEGASSPE